MKDCVLDCLHLEDVNQIAKTQTRNNITINAIEIPLQKLIVYS